MTSTNNRQDGNVAAAQGQGTVLVTGANRGIGLGLALALRDAGFTVIATARRPAEARELVEKGIEVLGLDVGNAESVRSLARALAGRPIDVLINNAGIFVRTSSLDGLDPDDVERVIHVNAVGPLRVTQALLPHLRAGEGKVIVMMSSRLGSIESNREGGHYGYRESKAALNMLARSLASELRPEGFRVVTMSPGWVRTDMGGAEAPLSVEESVTGIVRVLRGLTDEHSGCFLGHEGDAIAW